MANTDAAGTATTRGGLRRRTLFAAPLGGLAAMLPRGARAQAAGAPIPIGLSAALTAQFAQNGLNMRNGVNLALAEINAKGGVKGRPLELFVEDDQGPNPVAAANAITKLITQSNVVAIIGPHNTPAVLPNLQRLLQAKVPALTGASGPAVTQQNNPYIFRTRLNDALGAELLVSYVLEKLGWKRVGLCNVNTAFGQGGIAAVKAALLAKGVSPVLEQSHLITTKDFTPQVLAFQEANADGVLLWTDDQPAGLFAKQMATLGVKYKLAGSAGLAQPVFMTLAGEASNGVYSLTDFAADNPAPEAVEYRAKYAQKYGQPPELFASSYYDAAHLLAAAMQQASEVSGAAIRDALCKTQNYRGVTNTYSWTEGNDMVRTGFITRNENGRPLSVATISK